MNQHALDASWQRADVLFKQHQARHGRAPSIQAGSELRATILFRCFWERLRDFSSPRRFFTTHALLGRDDHQPTLRFDDALENRYSRAGIQRA
jgi:hypothetical protein